MKNPNFDLYSQIYVIFTNADIIRVYPAQNFSANDFDWLNTQNSDNWFINAKKITNTEQSYFVFLDNKYHTSIIAKPFFNSSNNEIIGIL